MMRSIFPNLCDCFQYVVIPTRRSTAEAVQILVSHALGDAGSPYLIGVVCTVLYQVCSHDGTWQIKAQAEIEWLYEKFGCIEIYGQSSTKCFCHVHVVMIGISLLSFLAWYRREIWIFKSQISSEEHFAIFKAVFLAAFIK